MSHIPRALVFTALLLVLALVVPPVSAQGPRAVLSGPSGGVATSDTITVGCKNFTEQEILGEIVAQLIERKTDLDVVRYFRIGGTVICHDALLAGDIDVYVEYTGVGLDVLGQTSSGQGAQDHHDVAVGYRDRFGAMWAPMLGLNTAEVVAVPESVAAEHGWTRISDLAADADEIRLASAPEFILLPGGYQALCEAYGFEFAKALHVAPEDAPAVLRSGDIYAFRTYATDGHIAELGLRVLEDDRAFFTPFEAAPVFGPGVLDRHPDLHELLVALTNTISAAQMGALIHRVDERGVSPAEVAGGFLDELGLYPEPDATDPAPTIAPDDFGPLEGRFMPTGMMLRNGLISSIPELLALTAALVFVLMGRHRKPAVYFMIAMGLLVLARFTWPFYSDWVWRRTMIDGLDDGGALTWIGRFALQLVELGALALLLIAALRWRSREGTLVPGPATASIAPARASGARIAGTLQPVSKELFLGTIVGPLAFGLILLVPAQALIYLDRGRNAPAGLGFACGSELFTIFGAVMLAILVYKLWARIQGEPTTRATPGKAVGYLFIPFFNFYWLFQAYWGWTKDYNALVAARGIDAPRAPEGLALTFCVLALVSMVTAFIPFLGLVFSAVNLVLLTILLKVAITGVNAIVAASGPPPVPEDELAPGL